MYLKPIETIPINWNRPRLKYLVPLEELLKLLKLYKDGNQRVKENTLKKYTEKTIDKADKVFTGDLLDFYLLLTEYNTGFYKITENSKKLLSKRLNISYADCLEFNFFLTNLKNEKILEKEKEIVPAEEKAFEVIILTKEISNTFNLEIRPSFY